MSELEWPIFEAFGNNSRRSVARVFAELDPDARLQMRELAARTEVGRETIRQTIMGRDTAVGVLLLYGVVDIEDDTKPAPFYQPADTPVMDYIREHGLDWLEPFAQSLGTKRLTKWFVEESDPEKSYSATAVDREGGANFRTANKHLERFHEAGLLAYDAESPYDEYSLDTEGTAFQRLRELNELCYETYSEREHLIDELRA